MAMTLLSLCSYTVFFVAQMWLNILHAGYLSLAILQSVTLIVYLWGPEKLRSKPLKILYRILYATSFFVIPSFVFIFMGLLSQYHKNIPEAVDATIMAPEELVPTKETTIYNTGTVYVFFPEYSDINLVCEKRPSKSDASVTWCSGAAFQHTVSLGFSQENIEGDHAVNGILYESPYNKDAFAAFVFANGEYAFDFDHPTEAMKEAAEAALQTMSQMSLHPYSADTVKAQSYDFRSLRQPDLSVCIFFLRPSRKFAPLREHIHIPGHSTSGNRIHPHKRVFPRQYP